MSNEWVVQPNPIVKFLRPISPSSFHSFQKCRWQHVLNSQTWTMNNKLPGSEKATLGTLVHRVYEECSKRQYIEDISNCQDEDSKDNIIRDIWDRIAAELQQQQSVAWNMKQFPQVYEVKDYAVKKLVTIADVKRQVERDASHYQAESTGRKYGVRIEEKIAARDNKIIGKVDRIETDGDHVTISDLKTGTIVEQGDQIKESYQIQLKMYAAMYFEKYRKWPEILRLYNHAQKYDLSYDFNEARDLLNEAEQKYDELKKVIGEGILESEGSLQLATQCNETCRFCSVRPFCSAYKMASEKLPGDIYGRIRNIDQLGNGLTLLRVEAENDLVLLRNFKQEHHPALDGLKSGDEVMIFGTYNNSSQVKTVVYSMGTTPV